MRNFLLFTLMVLNASFASAQKVYVTAGKTSMLYHKTQSCPAINGANVFSVTLSQAHTLGKSKCQSCYSATTMSSSNKNLHATQHNETSVQTSTTSLSFVELAKTAKNRRSQQITHVGYTTSYNSDWLIPNWVAYELTNSEVNGTYPRPKMQFEPDPLVKGNTAYHGDYTNSGYSRGHMAPAADMKWSEKAMYESFYLSNICPQKAELNGGVWEKLENRVRSLARESNVYVCCGPIMSNSPQRIGENKVAVPTKFFKVLCMQRKGKWQAIGFVFPNTDCKGSMFNYTCSVDEIEKLTGHDFFFNLPDDIENAVESTFNIKYWQ